MKHFLQLTFVFFACFFITCNKDATETNITDTPSDNNTMYFPPINTNTWETIDVNTLNWKEENLDALYTHLEENDTKAFIILKDGKIAIEKYFGLNASGNEFDEESYWYWASAGKTIISLAIGIAQQNGDLNINDKTATYLGTGWTSLSEDKEDLITIKHQLSMTTGLNYDVEDANCTTPTCLNYNTDAGNEWYYYNAPYLLLREVINNATNSNYKTYIQEHIEDKIGMTSPFWFGTDIEAIYWSNARDMARFGLLILNEGIWEDSEVLTDKNYFEEMTNTSQNLNEAYGYLWWLNGKNNIIYPSTTTKLSLELASNAPDDLIAAIGKNGQFIDVIPSENMVIIRMGEAPNEALVPVEFHNEMWSLINTVINQ